MPGHNHGPSIKKPSAYEGLKRHGFSKSSAAAISNWMAAGGRSGGRGRAGAKKGGKGRGGHK
jgi:hypothetical protein